MRNARNAFIAIAALTVVTAVFPPGVRLLHAQRARSAPERTLSRMDRLEAWIATVDQHTPGEADDPVLEINRWSSGDLRSVWIDVASLISLVREPGVSLFYVPGDPELRLTPSGWVTSTPVARTGRTMPIPYSGRDLQRLRTIAATLGPPTDGRENLLLKRGAMLHADIAMLAPADVRFTAKSNVGSRRYRLNMDDGRPTGIETEANHWDMGRRLLERVRSRDARGSGTRGPGMDETVRLWYVATCSHLISNGDLDPPHFIRAVELFPKDPDLLFLRGALHEAMASVRRQSAIRKADVPAGVTFAMGTRGDELLLAERFYERALDSAPNFEEARLHYARVLGEKRHHEEAVRELQKLAGVQGPLLQYYTALFLGGELEALGKDDEAVQAYQRAVELSPTAQSPRLGLSRVAAGRNRAAARESLLSLIEQEPAVETRDDPWWLYDVSAGRGADIVLQALHKAIEGGSR